MIIMEKKIVVTPKFLSRRKWMVDGWIAQKFREPFSLKAEDFFIFAKKDLKEKNLHGKVNAITNLKRCINNRLDTLLYVFGYSAKARKEKWSFPKKLECINKMGVCAPQVFQGRINLKRVLVEHGYRKPPKDSEISDMLEIAELFLNATNRMVKEPIEKCWFLDKKKNILEIELNISKGKMTVRFFRKSKRERRRKKEVMEKILTPNDGNYLDWVNFFVKLAYYQWG